jgi:hypothetical protein
MSVSREIIEVNIFWFLRYSFLFDGRLHKMASAVLRELQIGVFSPPDTFGAIVFFRFLGNSYSIIFSLFVDKFYVLFISLWLLVSLPLLLSLPLVSVSGNHGFS